MDPRVNDTIQLESLSSGIYVITPEAVGFYKENCMVCFNHNGHSSGLTLRVEGINEKRVFKISWNGDVTDAIIRAYGDLKRATDNAACAIALLLVRELTNFTAIEQAYIGTTIDYYLAQRLVIPI